MDTYDRLERDQSKNPWNGENYADEWSKLEPVGNVNGTLQSSLEAWCQTKRISLAGLEAIGTRVATTKPGATNLAWACETIRAGRPAVTAIKYRDLATGERWQRKPSRWFQPLFAGNPHSLDVFICEGETDSARLYDLAGGDARIVCVPLGARTFQREWADHIPRGARIYHAYDADTDGDQGAEKAQRILGGSRLRPPDGVKDWCEWTGTRADFIGLVKDMKLDERELVVLTARELCALPDPPQTDVLLGDLLIRGNRLVLGAHTGEGKTTMTALIIRAVVTGGQFLEWTAPGGGRALVIDAEQGLRTIKKQLRAAGLDQSDLVDYIRVPDGLELDSNALHIRQVDEQLRRHDYAVVSSDPLYKLHKGDSNDERQAVDLMTRFDAWRSELNFAHIMPVHCRKPPIGSKFTMHELFGSSAYLRGAEVILGLQRLSDGYSRLHFFKDRDGDLPIGSAWGLLFSRDEGYRRDPKDGKPSTKDQVDGLLTETPGMTVGDLVKATDVSEVTVRRAVKDLGCVVHSVRAKGEKAWMLPPDEAAQ